jgi:TATA-box binding protein (TBP) (component of TFIID and TFIIIB)
MGHPGFLGLAERKTDNSNYNRRSFDSVLLRMTMMQGSATIWTAGTLEGWEIR